MVFSSISFVFVFLPIVICVYHLIDKRLKNGFLLAASLFFYYWGEPKFLFVMLISILWNYMGGFLCGATTVSAEKKLWLGLAVMGNLCLLLYYKYFNFLIDTVNGVFSLSLPLHDIVLPIGISFFTFQGMSYVIDVFRGEVAVQKNPLKIALYISLFPQLIAGPIVRYSDIEKEISERDVSWSDFYVGMKRFVFGLAKKVIIANTLALHADNIFALNPENISQATAWLGALFYSFQIYYDFSGYSDMAIGLGRMMGFHFMENFNLPYISGTVREFWRRWHISLSTWFRDYLYIPLGGSRKGNVYANLLVVFLCTGLWHGASWNFVLWGLWHGVFLIMERIIAKRQLPVLKRPLLKTLGHVYTLMVVLMGWILFRADTLPYAAGFLKVLFGIDRPQVIFFEASYYLDNFTLLILAIAVLCSTDLPSRLGTKIVSGCNCEGVCMAAESAIVIVMMLICAVMVMASTYNPFIYFRF